MIHPACILGLLLIARLAFAADTPAESLDTVIARAIKPVYAGANVEPIEQRNAIDVLEDWPKTDQHSEEKIAAALKQARTVPSLSTAATLALGQRNRRELIPEYFARIETDPQALRSFFFSMREREKNPPLELLRRGFESKNPQARIVALEIAEWCRTVQLRPEIERLLVGDAKIGVRHQAAQALWLMGCRESLPVLRHVLGRGESASWNIGRIIAKWGDDTDVELLAPLLRAKYPQTRALIASAMEELRLNDPQPAIDAMLHLLEDPSRKVRLAAIGTLGKWKTPQVVPAIEVLRKSKKPPYGQDLEKVIDALGAVGNEAAVTMLNQMGFWNDRVRKHLLRLAHPSTAYAAWDAYLDDPIRPNPGSDVMIRGNRDALGVLGKLADEELFRAIRLRANKLTKGDWEKPTLEEIIKRLEQRYPEVAAEPIASLSSRAPSVPSDRDKDGVPDRRDRYPDDDRRSEDIPVAQWDFPVRFEWTFYGVAVLAHEGPAAKTPLFMATNADYRTSWITQTNEADPPDYHVASSFTIELEEWPMPNPGDTPGVYRLTPSDINGAGQVVGTALRKKVFLPLRQDIHHGHVTFQSGFIFEKGKIRFDPPAPFPGNSLNVSYRRINNSGLIFGHREERTREGEKDVFRWYAFLGARTFREVPPFEVNDFTDLGQLLCFRLTGDKQESFVWDGKNFQDLGSLAGRPEAVRAYAMNQKLQVVGLSDAVDKDHCPSGFLWEKGRMRPFSELIPEEFRPYIRSSVPYLITDEGHISFRAERKEGPLPQFWPKHEFLLQRGEDGQYAVSIKMLHNQNPDE